MVLIIDNYDSFTYNLVQLAGSCILENAENEIKVIRNDAASVQDIKEMSPSHIIISPGPGYPKDAGICEDVIRELKGFLPILGVCLGHQGICETFGGTITLAKQLMHGKQSEITIDNQCPLFQGLDRKMKAARYHSLIAERETLPKELIVTAEDAAGEVMAVKHREYEVYGVQFHPESILTPEGIVIMKNFLLTAESTRQADRKGNGINYD